VYSLILGDIQVSDIISSITVSNFSYLHTHHEAIRRGLVAALNRYSGSKEELVDKISNDLSRVIASEEMNSTSMEGFSCREVSSDILKKHIMRLIFLILNEETDISERFVKISKTMLGELIYELAEGNNNGPQGVIMSLRASICREYNPMVMGMAGMVFGLLEGKIVAIYN
jgi:hypothetical protein